MKPFYIVLLAVLLCSCKKLTEFTITNTSNFMVNSTTSVNTPITILTPPVTTNSQYAFSSNQTDANHVKQITLQQLSLTITNPTGQNFDFLQSVKLSISASGLTDQEVAYNNNVPKGVTTIA